MDTLSWNFTPPGSRHVSGGAGANYPAEVSPIGSTVCYSSNVQPGLCTLSRSATLRSGMLPCQLERQNLLNTVPQAEVHFAGQIGSAGNEAMRFDANTQPMQPPTISISNASPSPREQDPMLMMDVVNAPASSSRADLPSISETHEATNTSHLNSVAQEFFRSNTSMMNNVSCMSNRESSINCVPFPMGIRRQDATNLKGFLKLDVNMGFAGDAKIDSPTSMLQPVNGWNRRRSVSDVGPRTPSMLGPSVDALTSPIDDLSYLVNSMGCRPHSDKAHENLTNSTEQHSAFNFDSLNLHVDTDHSRGATDGFVYDLDGSGNNREKPPLLGANQVLPGPVDAPLLSEPTLNPTFVQSPMSQNTYLEQTFSTALGDAPLYRSLSNHKEESAAGPIRTCASGRSSRSVSPYHTPTRSVTPESERSLDENVYSDPVTRMSHWRFPVMKASPQSDALHPMDAYAHSNPNPGLSPGIVRIAPHASRMRRHMRAAVSEDIRSNEKVNFLGSWGNSLDLTRQERTLFANTSMLHEQSISHGMMRCVSSPVKMNHSDAISDQSLGLGFLASAQSPSLASRDAISKATGLHAPSLSEGALPTTVKKDSVDSSLQTAAQTRTPVVTTSAAQAASASRRKAEALFTCPFPDCGSTFTRQYNLRGHLRSHMDERPFKCEWPGCGRSFARTHDCKRHHNLHLNIKPYQCEGCGKTFARLDALNRHHKSEASTCGAKASEANKPKLSE